MELLFCKEIYEMFCIHSLYFEIIRGDKCYEIFSDCIFLEELYSYILKYFEQVIM